MDEQTQSFLELTAKDDLVQLAADKRAAWLWSADGARILWANAAGAAFFASRSIADLQNLAALERSPARPHIARIAESGATDRFSIDRLRFYRGLRVMLLTCQCKRLEMDTGEAAALIVCGDKGLATTKDPVTALAHLIAADGTTTFVTEKGVVAERAGSLSGTPEDLALPDGQNVLFGPLELDGSFHEGAVVNMPDGRKLVVLENEPLPEGETDLGEAEAETGGSEAKTEAHTGLMAAGAVAAGTAGTAPDTPAEAEDKTVAVDTSETANAAEDTGWVRADDDEDIALLPDASAGQDMGTRGAAPEVDAVEAAASPASSHESALDEDAVSEEGAQNDSGLIALDQVETEEDLQSGTTPEEAELEDPGLAQDSSAAGTAEDDADGGHTAELDEVASAEEEAAEDDLTADDAHSEQASLSVAAEGFTFQPRRRPVRFAWKMDIDQRFTFLSDEFADVLGPVATDIVGLTWDEVSDRFDLDPRGQIARALDRRDTWSGKTVNWPVSGAALRVPVDMAALPAFDRHRKFEGYRGFGVCRTADAIPAPDGLMLSPALAAFDKDTLSESGTDTGAAEETDREETAVVEAVSERAASKSIQDIQSDATPPEESSSVEREAVLEADPVAAEDEDIAEDAAAVDDTLAEDDEPTAPAVSEAPPVAEASLADLKPAKPNTFAGKTFLGASAAALVGSLAKFTGKSAQQAPEKTGKPVESAKPEPVAQDVVSAVQDRAAPAAETPKPTSEESMDDLPGAALDDKLQALEAGRHGATAPGPASGETPEAGEAEVIDEPAEAKPGEEAETLEAPTDAEDTGIADVPDDSSEDLAGEVEAAEEAAPEEQDNQDDGAAAEADAGTEPSIDTAREETADAEADLISDGKEESGAGSETAIEPEPVRSTEPTGIAGPAALKPAEIESAVKSLAKTYKENEKKARDLFDRSPEDAGDEDVAKDIEEEISEDADAADTLLSLPEVGDDAEDAEDAALAVSEAEDDEDLFEPVPAFEDAHFDVIEEIDREIEATAGEIDDSGKDESEDGKSPEKVTVVSDEERDFFEETAAFEDEDKAAEADKDETPPAQRTGEVIPLATVKPRLVPVDTSGLSRPERQAFRKIAEALGARLEGDLADFDAPDPVQPPEEELPPEVPEAGPIDPSLLDRLPIGIAIAHDREVLYANKALIRMLGYKSVSALAEAGGLEALFIDDTEELPDAEGMDGEVDEAMKLRLANGGVLNVDAHMHAVPWNGNRGLMISITERKAKPAHASAAPASPNFFAEIRSELDSARSQIAEMDTILETATDGVLVLDQHGTIIKVNGSAEALFSANRADMIGSPFTEFLAPESHRAAADYLDGLTRNGVASILNDGREVLGKVPAGGLIPLFMTIGRISGGKDDAKYCAVLRDITQWKTAEEELTQAKRQAENASSQKSDFLAKISHEIRTPLNAIIGFSEVMMEERFGPIGNDRYKDYLKDIRTSGSHIMSLINDLLDLSKIEAGKLDLKFSAVSTNDVISECVALMQPQANRERVIIRASLPESVPNVVADPRSLRQIVLNLLSNAIKYNKSGGQVILSTALESNGEVALRVRDTGTGMTAKQLAAALEPFRQLHTASRGGGTGLGLPLTKALVEANRASFHIDSTPDQGTLVEIIFPTQRVLSE